MRVDEKKDLAGALGNGAGLFSGKKVISPIGCINEGSILRGECILFAPNLALVAYESIANKHISEFSVRFGERLCGIENIVEHNSKLAYAIVQLTESFHDLNLMRFDFSQEALEEPSSDHLGAPYLSSDVKCKAIHLVGEKGALKVSEIWKDRPASLIIAYALGVRDSKKSYDPSAEMVAQCRYLGTKTADSIGLGASVKAAGGAGAAHH